MKKQFETTWAELRGSLPHTPHFLEAITIDGIRGLKKLNVSFSFPVSVIAGQNASGKSTVLFALSCAYKAPPTQGKPYLPYKLFPSFTPAKPDFPSDKKEEKITFEYYHRKGQERFPMRWGRSTSGRWGKSFFGRPGARQPEREVYLRTLSQLSSPSELRSFVQLERDESISSSDIDASLIHFAEQILPFRYKRLVKIESKHKRPFLFAHQENGGESQYSEFHMSGGERAVLRLSLDASKQKNALILIDEVETGLHPHAQEKLMLQLQRIALRRGLQIVVTTHSPVVLSSVPPEARKFLERVGHEVKVQPPYRDFIQHALYGRVRDTLSILCEDSCAEAILRGIFDRLSPEMGLHIGNDVKIGRDTGRDEFRSHFRTVKKFGMEKNFLFVMDGDARHKAEELKKEEKLYDPPNLPTVLCLTGNKCPEEWIWEMLKKETEEYAKLLGNEVSTFSGALAEMEQLYASASDSESNIAKHRLASLADNIGRDKDEIARAVARQEAEQERGEFQAFVNNVRDIVAEWRRPV